MNRLGNLISCFGVFLTLGVQPTSNASKVTSINQAF